MIAEMIAERVQVGEAVMLRPMAVEYGDLPIGALFAFAGEAWFKGGGGMAHYDGRQHLFQDESVVWTGPLPYALDQSQRFNEEGEEVI